MVAQKPAWKYLQQYCLEWLKKWGDLNVHQWVPGGVRCTAASAREHRLIGHAEDRGADAASVCTEESRGHGGLKEPGLEAIETHTENVEMQTQKAGAWFLGGTVNGNRVSF